MMDLSQNPLCRPFDFAGNPATVLLVHGLPPPQAPCCRWGEGATQRGYRVKGDLIARPRDNGGRHGTRRWPEWIGAVQDGLTSCRRNASASAWLAFRWEGTLALLLAQTRPVYRAVPICAALPRAQPRQPFCEADLAGDAVSHGLPTIPPVGELGGIQRLILTALLSEVAELNALIAYTLHGLKTVRCPLQVRRKR